MKRSRCSILTSERGVKRTATIRPVTKTRMFTGAGSASTMASSKVPWVFEAHLRSLAINKR